MGVGQIKLYDLFRKELHLADDKAAAFVLAVEDIAGQESDSRMQFVSTKEDIHRLEISIQESSNELRKEIRELAGSTKEDVHRLEINIQESSGELRKEIRELAGSTKEDIRQLEIKTELNIQQSSNELRKEIRELAISTKEDVRQLTGCFHNLEVKIEKDKGAIYKAVYWTSIAQFLAILAAVMAIVKFMK
jgi:hypothetical protein